MDIIFLFLMRILFPQENLEMPDFPRTTIDRVSVSRLVAGTNSFLGFPRPALARMISSAAARPASGMPEYSERAL
jgi:hypothetical protein